MAVSCFSILTSTSLHSFRHLLAVHLSPLPISTLHPRTPRPSPSLLRSFSSYRIRKPPNRVQFSDSDSESENNPPAKNLPPPYNPFSKRPVVEEPSDPKNLQEIFYKMRTEGLIPNAVKMFDFLSKDGRTHEAMELFSVIKDNGNMPDVVAHTAVIEAYANAGQSKEALKVYLRMLAAGTTPNAYTYTVLVKGLTKDGKLLDAGKYLVEMMGKGIRPNAAAYVPVFEGLFKEERAEEARELLGELGGMGFAAADEMEVKENLSSKRGHVYRSVMELLFGK